MDASPPPPFPKAISPDGSSSTSNNNFAGGGDEGGREKKALCAKVIRAEEEGGGGEGVCTRSRGGGGGGGGGGGREFIDPILGNRACKKVQIVRQARPIILYIWHFNVLVRTVLCGPVELLAVVHRSSWQTQKSLYVSMSSHFKLERHYLKMKALFSRHFFSIQRIAPQPPRRGFGELKAAITSNAAAAANHHHHRGASSNDSSSRSNDQTETDDHCEFQTRRSRWRRSAPRWGLEISTEAGGEEFCLLRPRLPTLRYYYYTSTTPAKEERQCYTGDEYVYVCVEFSNIKFVFFARKLEAF